MGGPLGQRRGRQRLHRPRCPRAARLPGSGGSPSIRSGSRIRPARSAAAAPRRRRSRAASRSRHDASVLRSRRTGTPARRDPVRARPGREAAGAFMSALDALFRHQVEAERAMRGRATSWCSGVSLGGRSVELQSCRTCSAASLGFSLKACAAHSLTARTRAPGGNSRLGGLVEEVHGGLDALAAADMDARAVLQAVGADRGVRRAGAPPLHR